MYYCNMVEWFWWDSSLILMTNWFSSVISLHSFDTVGLVIWPVKIIPKMTYNLLSGTLNRTHSRSVTLWCPERQSTRMSKIKIGGLDQYGAEPFKRQQFGTGGVEWVKKQQQQTSAKLADIFCMKFIRSSMSLSVLSDGSFSKISCTVSRNTTA